MSNKRLNEIKRNPNDEFYTPLEHVEYIALYLKKYLSNKIVYCNCDDYRWSSFYLYCKDNFYELGLKKLIATNYNIGNGSYHAEFDGLNEIVLEIENGSFDSDYCIELLKQSDIIFTNPPFSLKNKFLDLILNNNKDYIFLCSYVAFKKLPHKFIKEIKIISSLKEYTNKLDLRPWNNIGPGCYWFNSFENKYVHYNKEYKSGNHTICEQTGYRNYDKCIDIDLDYTDYMFVPITIIQHKIIENYDIIDTNIKNAIINGKHTFHRYLIKKKEN